MAHGDSDKQADQRDDCEDEWLLNGEPVEGATGSSLNIPWRSLSADEPPDQYQVVACYEYEDGTILKSEPSDPVEISYARPGVMMIFQ